MNTIEISEPYFSFIREGKKKVEGRKNSLTWKHLKVGSILNVINSNNKEETIKAKILKINYYDSLMDYLFIEGLENVLPGVNNYEEGKRVYLNFWSEGDISKYGIMAIHLEVL